MLLKLAYYTSQDRLFFEGEGGGNIIQDTEVFGSRTFNPQDDTFAGLVGVLENVGGILVSGAINNFGAADEEAYGTSGVSKGPNSGIFTGGAMPNTGGT